MPITATTRVHGSSPAAAQLIDAVERRTGIRLSTSDGTSGEIELLIDHGSSAPEGYTLEIGERAIIVGADEAGLFYGVQTLLQLLRQDDSGWALLGADIADSPRFPRRGVMLDVARHFFGVD